MSEGTVEVKVETKRIEVGGSWMYRVLVDGNEIASDGSWMRASDAQVAGNKLAIGLDLEDFVWKTRPLTPVDAQK